MTRKLFNIWALPTKKATENGTIKIKLFGRVIISKWYAMRPENNCILYAKKILKRFRIDMYLWSQIEQFIDFFDWREDPNYGDRVRRVMYPTNIFLNIKKNKK